MGCEFEFGYTAGLLLGRAEPAGRGGAIRGVVDLDGGAIHGVVAAWWRRGGGVVSRRILV